MTKERLQGIKDSIDFQREILIAHNMNTLCVDEEQELYDYAIDLQSKIDKANELIKIEKEKMGYAKYDSCLLLIENVLKEDK